MTFKLGFDAQIDFRSTSVYEEYLRDGPWHLKNNRHLLGWGADVYHSSPNFQIDYAIATVAIQHIILASPFLDFLKFAAYGFRI